MRFILGLLLCFSCHKNDESKKKIHEYNFNGGPDLTLTLPADYDEVSGLAYSSQYLLLHNDEQAFISKFMIQEPDLSHVFTVVEEEGSEAVHDDFEGIALIGEDLYLINSNGDIYHCIDRKESVYRYKKYKGPKGAYEFESLCYDPDSKKLLTITKDVKKKKYRDQRFAFSFDPVTKEYDKEPYFELNIKEIRRFGIGDDFYPSGMEVHPVFKTYFIISAKSAMIAEVSKDGEILRVDKLKNKKHRQAEGITFDENANLYIADEANGKKAVLSRYDYISD